MVSEDVLWKQKSRFTEGKKNHIWCVRTYNAKNKPLNVDEKNSDTKMVRTRYEKKIRLEKIRIVMVSEDIF